MVSCPCGKTPRYCVRPIDPRKRAPINAAITQRVRLALRETGSRNAVTPLLMASIPVRAVHPAAKVWSRRKEDTGDRRRRPSPRSGSTAQRHQEAPDQHGEERRQEQVHRNGHDRPKLTQAAQVGDRDQDQERDGHFHPVGPQSGEGGSDRRHAGREADPGREDVVDHQSAGRHQPDLRPEVFLSDRVGAAAAGVGPQRLGIRQGQHAQQGSDRQRDSPGEDKAGGAGDDQAEEDLLVGIGDGRKSVGRKGRQGADLVEPFRFQPLRGQRWPDEPFQGGAHERSVPLGAAHQCITKSHARMQARVRGESPGPTVRIAPPSRCHSGKLERPAET